MDELKLTCAKFFAFSNISIFCYSQEGEVLFCFPDFYSDLKEDFVKDCILKMETSDPDRQKPFIFTLDNRAHIATIPLPENLTLFLGPVSQTPEGMLFPPIYKIYSNRQLCLKMNYEKFINAISLLIQLCTGKINQSTQFVSRETPTIDINNTFNDSLPNPYPRISYPGEALEQKLLTFIEKGNVKGLMDQFELPSNITIETMSSDPVQHQKYVFIIFMTMAVRAAVKGGLDDEKAFDIVRIYCLKMDKCTESKEITSLIYNMALSLCREVSKYGIKSSISPEIRKCCTYISSHLYDSLDLKKLAAAADMSTRNLSNRFHKEIGVTPMSYVQMARIEEAQFLLHYTMNSLLDISNALHFSSQSHFTSVFHHVTGKTPKQYQETKRT